MIAHAADPHIIIIITLRVDIFKAIAGQRAEGGNVSNAEAE
jgi:hypothetical protein